MVLLRVFNVVNPISLCFVPYFVLIVICFESLPSESVSQTYIMPDFGVKPRAI